MQFTEGTVPGIRLTTFEDSVTALAAVVEVHGENHPLTLPYGKDNGFDVSLYDEVRRHIDAEPQDFEGEHTAIIMNALKSTADNKGSNYQASARFMLDQALSDSLPTLRRVENPIPRKKLSPLPTVNAHGEIISGHVVLESFGDLVTALRVTCEFGDEDESGLVAKLRQTIEEVDPLDIEPVVFWGNEARVIYNGLHQAAQRGTELHDPWAHEMIIAGVPGEAPIASSRELMAA